MSTLADGSTVRLPLLVAAGRSPRPRLVITAGIHGDEYEGPRAITDLLGTLDPAALEGTVVAVPVANPPAFAAGTRTSPLDGLNLARIFPGDPDGTISQRIAYTLVERIVRGADLLVDLHSGGVRYHFAQTRPATTSRPDASPLARRAAIAMSLPYLWAIPATPAC